MYDERTAKTIVTALKLQQRALNTKTFRDVVTVGELEDTHRALQLAEDIAAGNTIASLWSVADIFSLDSDNFDDDGNYTGDITVDQAREALALAERNHDAEYGINWDSLRAALETVQEG